VRVLADGEPHDAGDILARAQTLGLLPQSTTRKYMYIALHEYVERTRGAGRDPEFVQVSALGELAREFTSETGIPVAAVLDGSQRLAEAVEREVFAIAAEAFANIRQHARASHVDLSLQRCDEGVRLTIRDDGVGFAPDHDRGGRFGIVGMKERAAAAGARLAIESGPETGTLVEIRLGPRG